VRPRLRLCSEECVRLRTVCGTQSFSAAHSLFLRHTVFFCGSQSLPQTVSTAGESQPQRVSASELGRGLGLPIAGQRTWPPNLRLVCAALCLCLCVARAVRSNIALRNQIMTFICHDFWLASSRPLAPTLRAHKAATKQWRDVAGKLHTLEHPPRWLSLEHNAPRTVQWRLSPLEAQNCPKSRQSQRQQGPTKSTGETDAPARLWANCERPPCQIARAKVTIS